MKNPLLLMTIACLLLTACVKNNFTSAGDQLAANNQRAASYHIEMAIRYLEKSNIERARAKLNYALELAPDWPPALGAMGYYMEQIGEAREAEQYYLKALGFDPKSASSQNNYGTFLCRQQQYDKAQQYFLAAARHSRYDKTAEAYENAGICSLEAKRYAAAEQFFKKAILQAPNRAMSLYQLADLKYQQGKYAEANRYLLRFRVAAPESAASVWLAIRVAHAMGQSQKASQYAATLKGKYSHSKEYQLYQKLKGYEQTS